MYLFINNLLTVVLKPQQDPINPCVPSPCGPYSECRVTSNTYTCTCLQNYQGSPPQCHPECTSNSECRYNLACINMKCKDPCIGSCGLSAECHVYNHIPQCICPQGLVGNPFVSCYIQQSSRKNDSNFYDIVNNNVFLITYLIYNSKFQNYVHHPLFSVKIIYFKLDFNYRLLTRYISILLNIYISTNKIQCRLRSSFIYSL